MGYDSREPTLPNGRTLPRYGVVRNHSEVKYGTACDRLPGSESDPRSGGGAPPPPRPPAGAGTGSFRFLVGAQGQPATGQLPLNLTVGQVLPPRLTLTAELPVLRGPATSSFRYRLPLKNARDRALLVSLEARA